MPPKAIAARSWLVVNHAVGDGAQLHGAGTVRRKFVDIDHGQVAK